MQASAFTEEQLQWLESDDDNPSPALEVSEGELAFLPTTARKPEHWHNNRIWIDETSIRTGWTRLHQCHHHLDAVSALQIVYHKARIRNLVITRYKNIAKAFVQGPTVQLQNIKPDSQICISAESRTLSPEDEKHFTLKNGPFMRRFLDGYYPMTVSLVVYYPAHLLKFMSASPAQRPGWTVKKASNQIILHGRFEGRLETRLRFRENIPKQ